MGGGLGPSPPPDPLLDSPLHYILFIQKLDEGKTLLIIRRLNRVFQIMKVMVQYLYQNVYSITIISNPYSAGIDFKLQNLTPVDVRF